MTRIGIIREGKMPYDRRVPITPEQAAYIQSKYPDVSVVCQPSPHRCYSDKEYIAAGIEMHEDLGSCDILFGVKEVPIDQLIKNKTYLFFSHTIKAQPYNRGLLQAILENKITLIDYETLYDSEHKRVVAFGRYAGIVGAYNALWTFGKRYNLYSVKRAHECRDMDEMMGEYKKIKLPPLKIVVTGGGRVGKGSLEVLMGMGIKKVSPTDLISSEFKFPVFCQLNSRDYYRRKDGKEFVLSEFFKSPQLFECDFLEYAKKADILIAGAYWDPSAPKLFTQEDMKKRDFSLRVIADITCDIDGSIPSTKKATTIENPVYDFNPDGGTMERAFIDEGNITVMAVDNLPAELPRNSSIDFGRDLITHSLPNLLGKDEGMIADATIAKGGVLTKKYQYLQAFVDGV